MLVGLFRLIEENIMSKDNLVWKLIDKQGYFGEDTSNKVFYDNYFVDDIVYLSKINTEGEGSIGDIEYVIEEWEFEYFEPVVKQGSKLWDGISTLMIGMTVTRVNSHGTVLVVELIKGNQAVLSEQGGGITIVLLDNLKSLLPSPKEQFCELMLNKVRGSHMDFAYDTTWDIRELSKWCYEELMEGK
jgi:hypothetical protein